MLAHTCPPGSHSHCSLNEWRPLEAPIYTAASENPTLQELRNNLPTFYRRKLPQISSQRAKAEIFRPHQFPSAELVGLGIKASAPPASQGLLPIRVPQQPPN